MHPLLTCLFYYPVEATCDVGSTKERLSQEFPSIKFDHLPDFWWYCPPQVMLSRDTHVNPVDHSFDCERFWREANHNGYGDRQRQKDEGGKDIQGQQEEGATVKDEKEEEEVVEEEDTEETIFLEPKDEFMKRVEKFREWLRGREEKTIAIFGHHDYLWVLSSGVVHVSDDTTFDKDEEGGVEEQQQQQQHPALLKKMKWLRLGKQLQNGEVYKMSFE